MNTFILTNTKTVQSHNNNKPVTARGRALYTTAWFMYGSPRSMNYDNATVSNKGGLPC